MISKYGCRMGCREEKKVLPEIKDSVSRSKGIDYNDLHLKLERRL